MLAPVLVACPKELKHRQDVQVSEKLADGHTASGDGLETVGTGDLDGGSCDCELDAEAHKDDLSLKPSLGHLSRVDLANFYSRIVVRGDEALQVPVRGDDDAVKRLEVSKGGRAVCRRLTPHDVAQ
eukprot:scaffold61244_cov31-Tisochrysis_lutea.AAC.4